MTRNDIAKSLKPIEWAYNHDKGVYTAILGVGGRGVELVIELLYNSPSVARLTAYRNNAYAPECIRLHPALDSAMQEARNFLVNEVCNLFELDEQ
jgi:hypothetical protein|nr:MAG TPA: Protein of unknown function (DUF2459) [Caudoviricetes sp.]